METRNMMYTNKTTKYLPINSQLKLVKSVDAEDGILHLVTCGTVVAWIHSRDVSDVKTEVIKNEVKKKRK